MPDYYAQFSCIFKVGGAGKAAQAETIRGELTAEPCGDEGDCLGFGMLVEHEYGPGALWICSDEYGEPEHVIAFVLRCAEAFDLQGVWGFTWSLGCSRPLLDAFGGGGHVIDLGQRNTVAWVDCNDFVSERTKAGAAVLEATT
jgi:hypothetical protein